MDHSIGLGGWSALVSKSKTIPLLGMGKALSALLASISRQFRLHPSKHLKWFKLQGEKLEEAFSISYSSLFLSFSNFLLLSLSLFSLSLSLDKGKTLLKVMSEFQTQHASNEVKYATDLQRCQQSVSEALTEVRSKLMDDIVSWDTEEYKCVFICRLGVEGKWEV